MTMTKITPEQAFNAAKVLWPNLAKIQWQVSGVIVRFDDSGIVTVHGSQIDWPEGVTQWPMPEKWRDAKMPEDWGKAARFRDTGLTWRIGRTIAGLAANLTGPWIDSNGAHWMHCQVRDDSPIITEVRGVKAGDGWRLLYKDEVIQKGDEFWSTIHESPGLWNSHVSEGSTPRQIGHVYRRRIEVQP